MKLLLERIANVKRGTRAYCIGHLYNVTDGIKVYLCDTIEDIDRGLSQEYGAEKNKSMKVFKQTAIPVGTYAVTTKQKSGTFSKKNYYKDPPCCGYLPRLKDVQAFDGILMHMGTNENSSAGCIILGYNKVVGQVVESRKAYEKLIGIMKYHTDGHTITITRKYKV